ncbi:IPT/TIG domain-containing protein [Rhodococcus jostii]|uniref:IPT/TIG domain-containing protein n=2 Tax=Rhodococcus jostii TaxID=132919 RepID=UPI0036269B15
MAAPSVSTIANAKPVVAGGVLRGPLQTPLPTDASTSFDAGMKRLGHVSEDGLAPEGERSTNAVRDWGGDVIAQLQTEHSSRFTFTLYGVFDTDVLKAAFGDDNVVTVGGKSTVIEDGAELPHGAWAFDMRGDGGKKTRICIPDGQPSNVTEASMVAGELQSLTLTIEAFKDGDGVKVYRYYDDGSAASVPLLTSHTPSSLATAGGDLITLTGAHFTGTTAVAFGGTAAGDFTVINDTTLVAVSPAKTAGSVNVVVTNATGASATHAVTYA